jgi:DNA-binding MarR family transcriptional regulator
MRMDRRTRPSPADQPRFGALLRLCTQHARRHIIEAIGAAGFTDLQDAHLAVFQYPAPDGVRPSELARRIRMSRQATNYLISQLEQLGYLERRAAGDGDRRLVYLTRRGHTVFETIFAALRDLERRWADKVGRKRFDDFIEVLRALAEDERQTLFYQKPAGTAAPGDARQRRTSRPADDSRSHRPAPKRSPAARRRGRPAVTRRSKE